METNEVKFDRFAETIPATHKNGSKTKFSLNQLETMGKDSDGTYGGWTVDKADIPEVPKGFENQNPTRSATAFLDGETFPAPDGMQPVERLTGAALKEHVLANPNDRSQRVGDYVGPNTVQAGRNVAETGNIHGVQQPESKEPFSVDPNATRETVPAGSDQWTSEQWNKHFEDLDDDDQTAGQTAPESNEPKGSDLGDGETIGARNQSLQIEETGEPGNATPEESQIGESANESNGDKTGTIGDDATSEGDKTGDETGEESKGDGTGKKTGSKTGTKNQ